MGRENFYIREYFKALRAVRKPKSGDISLACFSEMASSPWLFRNARILPDSPLFWLETHSSNMLIFQRVYIDPHCSPGAMQEVFRLRKQWEDVATDDEVDAWWEGVQIRLSLEKERANFKEERRAPVASKSSRRGL